MEAKALKDGEYMNFFELVYRAVRLVPRGKVTTYSCVARFLGNPRGSRAVGWAMRVCPYSDVPCHRVVRADGMVAGYPEDVRSRITKLRQEKIKVVDRRVDLTKYFFGDFYRS